MAESILSASLPQEAKRNREIRGISRFLLMGLFSQKVRAHTSEQISPWYNLVLDSDFCSDLPIGLINICWRSTVMGERIAPLLEEVLT